MGINFGHTDSTNRLFKLKHKLNMSRDQRHILTKFRSCNLPLAIETGPYTKHKTRLNDRNCRFYSATSVEEEIHFLIECDFYSDTRFDLLESASQIYENVYQFNSEEKLYFFINSDVLQFNIANYLLAVFRRRKHAKI